MNLYKKLYNIPPQGLWCFLNNRNKKMFVSYNTDMLKSIAEHMRMMKRQEHPIKELNRHRNVLQLVILDGSVLDDVSAKLHIEYWERKYKEKGYSNYRTKKLLCYTVGYDVHGESVHVFLKSARNKKVVVGVFSSMFEATEFIEKCYSGKVLYPVYAINKLTKKWLQENVYDIKLV